MKALIERYQTDYYRAGTAAAVRLPRLRPITEAVDDGRSDLQRAPREHAQPRPRRPSPADLEARFRSLVQSPLRAGLLRYLNARPEESFDVESLMQTFGRLQLDVENCVRELVDFGVARKCTRRPPAIRGASGRPEAAADQLDEFLERRAKVSIEDQSPSVQRFREMIGRDEKMLVVFEWIRTAAKSDISVLDPRADRIGQGSRGPDDPRAEPAERGEVPGGQLRGAPGYAVRIGDLRLRERRVHGRARSQAGTPRAGQRGHAVSRRNRRHVAHRAGQAAARARGAPVRAPRRQQVHRRRLPADFGDQPSARTVRARRPVPRGSLLPRQRVRHPAALASRAAGGHPGARRSASWRATARRRACRSTARPSRAKPSTCSVYQWPGNIRELESTVSRAALSAPGRTSARPTSSSCTRPCPWRQSIAASACRRWPTPNARTSSACSRRSSGTRRRRRGCWTSAAARCTGRSWSSSSSPKPSRRAGAAKEKRDPGSAGGDNVGDEAPSRRGAAVRHSRLRRRRARRRCFAPHSVARPGLFIALLVCSSVASALKVSLPLATSGSTMSIRTPWISRRCCCSAPTKRWWWRRRARGASARSARRAAPPSTARCSAWRRSC